MSVWGGNSSFDVIVRYFFKGNSSKVKANCDF